MKKELTPEQIKELIAPVHIEGVQNDVSTTS